jgi:hypothetical protein
MHLTWLLHFKFRNENELVRCYQDLCSVILMLRFFFLDQEVRGLTLGRTSATSQFRPLRVPSDSTWSCSLKDMPPHDFGLFVCHQGVSGLALWWTNVTSRFRPVHVPSACTWSRSLKDKCHLTISASSCAISQYVVLLFEGQAPPHNFGLFVCHQYVRGLALWRTSATSQFWPLHVPSDGTWSHSLKDKHHLTILASSVPSDSTWSCSLKDKRHLTISASLCSIRMYVVPSFEAEWLLQLIFIYQCSWWIWYVFCKIQYNK